MSNSFAHRRGRADLKMVVQITMETGIIGRSPIARATGLPGGLIA
jgi:hypothetical protein